VTRQSCGSCVGSRGVLERFIAREDAIVAELSDRASRLGHSGPREQHP